MIVLIALSWSLMWFLHLGLVTRSHIFSMWINLHHWLLMSYLRFRSFQVKACNVLDWCIDLLLYLDYIVFYQKRRPRDIILVFKIIIYDWRNYKSRNIFIIFIINKFNKLHNFQRMSKCLNPYSELLLLLFNFFYWINK